MAAPRLALVHDYLTQRGGAERVVAAWCAAFPDAPLYTSLFNPESTFAEFANHRVVTSWLNAVPPLRVSHRRALALLAPTMSAWRIDAEVVLASSSGWAHGVRTPGALVVYCHAPARWLYQRDRYLGDRALGHGAHWAAHVLESPLRQWDQRAARRADRYLCNATGTRDALRAIYGIDAEVVAPPVTVPAHLPERSRTTDVLVVSRLLPYKNLDLVVAVARRLSSVNFVLVGDGPLRAALQRTAPPNVSFRGGLGDDALWAEYAAARVTLALSHEDFGLTVLEAAAAGVPAVARGAGGYLDTVTEETGILVSPEAIDVPTVASAVTAALARTWDADRLRARAAAFSPAAHVARLEAVIGDLAPR